jgi:hypothetical protein
MKLVMDNTKNKLTFFKTKRQFAVAKGSKIWYFNSIEAAQRFILAWRYV